MLVFPCPASGDCEDHATLLCSLLLGFCLDAYVVIGQRVNRRGEESAHVWVMTRQEGVGTDPATGARGYDVVFWESLTGQKCKPGDAFTSGHRYTKVCWQENTGSDSANGRSLDVYT